MIIACICIWSFDLAQAAGSDCYGGGEGWVEGGGLVVFAEDAAGVVAAFAAVETYAELVAHFGEAGCAAVPAQIADLVFCDLTANADVHGTALAGCGRFKYK